MALNLALISAALGISLGLLVLVLIWSLVWKAIALWKAARKGHLVWFIILLVVNTLGILEILYIFLFSKIELEQKKRRRARK
jgi:ABC-type multidrug transport system fused ATPase/permease subunit